MKTDWDLAALAAHDNVSCKISGLAAEYTEVLDLTASSLTGLSPSEQDALFRATATTVYGRD